MKPTFPLAASLVLNLALAGVIGHLLGARSAIAPLQNIASPPTAQTLPSLPESTASQSHSSAMQPPVQDHSQSASAVDSTSSISNFLEASLSLPATPSSPRARKRTAPNSRSDLPIASGQPVTSAALGNSLNFHGMHVAIAETYPDGKNGDALGVDVYPANDAVTEAAADNRSPSASSDPSSLRTSGTAGTSGSTTDAPASTAQTNTPVVNPWASQSGDPTQADELFQMKWGWAAFDAARSEARLEAEKKHLSK